MEFQIDRSACRSAQKRKSSESTSEPYHFLTMHEKCVLPLPTQPHQSKQRSLEFSDTCRAGRRNPLKLYLPRRGGHAGFSFAIRLKPAPPPACPRGGASR